MFKPLIAGITALSLSLSAAPVQAGGLTQDEIGKLIFGLAAIAAIGTLVENRQDRDQAKSTRAPTAWQTPQVQRPHHPQRDQRTRDRRVLPRECLTRIETRFGPQRLYGARCLRNTYAQADRLPRRCAVRMYTNNGPRRGFDPACLRREGFRTRR